MSTPRLCSRGAIILLFHLAVKSLRNGFIAGSFHNIHCGDCCASARRVEQSGTVSTSNVSAGKRFSAGGIAAESEAATSKKTAKTAQEIFNFILIKSRQR